MDDVQQAMMVGVDDPSELFMQGARHWLASRLQMAVIPQGQRVQATEPSKGDKQPSCPDEITRYLPDLLTLQYEGVLYEWLRLIFEHGYYLPCQVLPHILSEVKRYSLMRSLTVSMMGRQGFAMVAIMEDLQHDWVYHTQPFNRDKWLSINQQQQEIAYAMLTKIANERQADDEEFEQAAAHAAEVYGFVNDLGVKAYATLDMVHQWILLQRGMFALRGAWSNELSDLFWRYAHWSEDIAVRPEMRSRYQGYEFTKRLRAGLERGAYYIDLSTTEDAQAHIDGFRSLNIIQKNNLINHYMQICNFRRHMNEAFAHANTR